MKCIYQPKNNKITSAKQGTQPILVKNKIVRGDADGKRYKQECKDVRDRVQQYAAPGKTAYGVVGGGVVPPPVAAQLLTGT